MKFVYQVLVQSLTNEQRGDLLVKLLDDRGGVELAMALMQTEKMMILSLHHLNFKVTLSKTALIGENA